MRNKFLSPRWRQRASRIWIDELGGMPEIKSVDLDGFRFRDDDGNESSGGASFLAAENVNLTGQDGDSDKIWRIRILLEQDNAIHDQGDSTTPRLVAKLNTGGTYAIVPAAAAGTFIEMVASQLVDGDPTTDHGLTKTGGYTHNAGDQEETSGDAGSVTWTNSQNDSAIYEWSVKSLTAGLANNDEIFFRVTDGAQAFDTYTFGDTGDTNPIKIGFTVTAPAAGLPPWNRRLYNRSSILHRASYGG